MPPSGPFNTRQTAVDDEAVRVFSSAGNLCSFDSSSADKGRLDVRQREEKVLIILENGRVLSQKALI